MSARLVRRVLEQREGNLLTSSDPASEPSCSFAARDDEDCEERNLSSSSSAAPFKNPFDLLNEEDDENEVSVESSETCTEKTQSLVEKPAAIIPMNQKSRKKKKNRKDSSAKAKVENGNLLDSTFEDLSLGQKTSGGGAEWTNPTEKKMEARADDAVPVMPSVLTVDPKHLKAENELRRIFGSKVVNSFENQQSGRNLMLLRGGRRVVHIPRKTLLVTASSHWPRWDGSMSMELLETKNGLNYFRYVHSPTCIHALEAFEAAKAANDVNTIGSLLAHYPYHVEALLTFAELFKYSGEHESSAEAIGKCLYALECAWHPLFSPLNLNCCLKYSHHANKPLFNALFSHMKNLDRRGCHRSALEVCKLLLSLDPDDPKGAIFCIDYFSLRAQEYGWLERFCEEYKNDNSLWLFPNFSFSLPVARFYLEQKVTTSKGTAPHLEKATSLDLMKQALMLHPAVLEKLVAKAPLKDLVWSKVLGNSFFGTAKPGSPSLEHLIDIYIERSYILWRFPELQNLLRDAAFAVIESLSRDKQEAKSWGCIRKEAFSSDKNEYSHLMVSDFSDTTPSLPPEELRQLMIGPQVAIEVPFADAVAPGRPRIPRELAGRHPAVVFLESLLPWVDYGDDEAEAEAQDGRGHNAEA